ncbi:MULTISPECIES: hypothetical protein [unclassified Exiguobacterium]|nr:MULTISPECIES: hypothetical protein [unclassified Exiguobacterium]
MWILVFAALLMFVLGFIFFIVGLIDLNLETNEATEQLYEEVITR